MAALRVTKTPLSAVWNRPGAGGSRVWTTAGKLGRRSLSIPAKHPNDVRFVEVGPRDGLQNEKGPTVPVSVKVELIERLADAGLKTIEVGSLVSPKWVPQMAGTTDVMKQLKNRPDTLFSVLIPNARGWEIFKELGGPNQAWLADEVALFVGATDSFTRANVNCSTAEFLEKSVPWVTEAQKQGVRVRGYLSVVAVCPYEGRVAPSRVRDVANQLIQLGCYEVSLGDTVGQARPHEIETLLAEVTKDIDISRIAGHFHDTYGMGVANVLSALDCGVRTIDASVGGLGGCPYAPGATGNVATEDVLYALQGSKYRADGVDPEVIAEIGSWISDRLGRETVSRVGRAMKARKNTPK